MTVSAYAWPSELKLIRAALDHTAAVVRRWYRHADLHAGVTFKQELSSVVTAADRDIELTLRSLITARYPDDGISGEEFDAINTDSPRQWVIDPIDGTTAFMLGRPVFGTLIALVVDGVPTIGVVDQPLISDRWVGVRGHPTLFNGRPSATRSISSLSLCSAAINGAERLLDDLALSKNIARLRRHVAALSFGGDCYSYCAVASGWLDIVIEREPDWHDVAAMIPIIQGAGGVIFDSSGGSLTPGGRTDVVAASSRELGERVLRVWSDDGTPS